MKRNVCVLLTALLVFAVAGQAAAYFDDLNLIRSIYTTTGAVEVGSDLGVGVNGSSLTSPINETRGTAVNLGTFDGGLGSLVVGYFAHNQANKAFFATGNYNDGDGLTMLGRKQSGADTIYNNLQTLYATSSADTAIVNPKTTLGSYFNAFDKSGGPNTGSMGANLKSDSFEMTMSLADLATNGFVDQYLYFFNYNGSGSDVAGVEVAVIRTLLDGNQIKTVINPGSAPAVPVPAAVWLLGTGIVGLVGIRRRKS